MRAFDPARRVPYAAGALLIACSLALDATPAARGATGVTGHILTTTQVAAASIRFDQRRAAEFLKMREGRVALSDLLREVGAVELRAGARSRLVVHIYQMSGRDVARRFTSSAFDAPATGRVALGQVLRTGQPQYGTFSFEAAHLIEAAESIPVGAVLDDPGRFLLNGVIPFRPPRWEKASPVLIVAAPETFGPATGSVASGWPASTPVNIGVVFGFP